jgi:hypothetical protein
VTPAVSRLRNMGRFERDDINMMKSTLQKIDEQVKSQHAYWESLSPEERRAVVLKRRDANFHKSQKLSFLQVLLVFCV